MTFNGKYFDGKSSAGYPALVTLGNFGIQITFRGSDTSHSLEWEPDKIHPNDFAENDRIYLKYGDFPYQYLEIDEHGFGKLLKETYPNAKFHKTHLNFIFSTGFKGLAILTVICIGLLALAYFVVLPAAAEGIAGTIPVEWEQELGNAAYYKLVSEESVSEDNTARMNDFFKELNYKTKYDVEIVVVKEEVVNAFALPGGKIIVYEGILRAMDKYEELAALLSHEFSHVELKHSTKNMCRSLSSYFLISILFGDASGLTAVVVQNADQLKQLGYSRSLEEEADKSGLKLMKEAKVNPEGMKGLFEALKKEEGEVISDIPQFLSTHPLTDARINYVKEEIARNDYTVSKNESLDSLWKEIKKHLDE